jgi:hypothetical protein
LFRSGSGADVSEIDRLMGGTDSKIWRPGANVLPSAEMLAPASFPDNLTQTRPTPLPLLTATVNSATCELSRCFGDVRHSSCSQWCELRGKILRIRRANEYEKDTYGVLIGFGEPRGVDCHVAWPLAAG